MKVNKIENYEVTGVVINMQNTTKFEPVILTHLSLGSFFVVFPDIT